MNVSLSYDLAKIPEYLKSSQSIMGCSTTKITIVDLCLKIFPNHFLGHFRLEISFSNGVLILFTYLEEEMTLFS